MRPVRPHEKGRRNASGGREFTEPRQERRRSQTSPPLSGRSDSPGRHPRHDPLPGATTGDGTRPDRAWKTRGRTGSKDSRVASVHVASTGPGPVRRRLMSTRNPGTVSQHAVGTERPGRGTTAQAAFRVSNRRHGPPGRPSRRALASGSSRSTRSRSSGGLGRSGPPSIRRCPRERSRRRPFRAAGNPGSRVSTDSGSQRSDAGPRPEWRARTSRMSGRTQGGGRRRQSGPRLRRHRATTRPTRGPARTVPNPGSATIRLEARPWSHVSLRWYWSGGLRTARSGGPA